MLAAKAGEMSAAVYVKITWLIAQGFILSEHKQEYEALASSTDETTRKESNKFQPW